MMSYQNYLFAWEEEEAKKQNKQAVQISQKSLKHKIKKRNSRSSSITERRKWGPDEDDQLVKLIKKYGTKNWRVVASHLKERTPKQCRERWINHLDPAIIKGKLTEEEWNLVLESQEELGNRWSEIAKLLPGRTPNQIKNVWHAMMRRETKQRKPKRKLAMIDPMVERSSMSSEEDDVSESEDWLLEQPIPKKPKLSPLSSPDENPCSKLEALVEIALGLYEIEQESDRLLGSGNDSDEIDHLTGEEDIEDQGSPDYDAEEILQSPENEVDYLLSDLQQHKPSPSLRCASDTLSKTLKSQRYTEQRVKIEQKEPVSNARYLNDLLNTEDFVHDYPIEKSIETQQWTLLQV